MTDRIWPMFIEIRILWTNTASKIMPQKRMHIVLRRLQVQIFNYSYLWNFHGTFLLIILLIIISIWTFFDILFENSYAFTRITLKYSEISRTRYFNPFYNANLKRTGILQIQTNAHLISRIADFYCHLMEREPSVA